MIEKEKMEKDVLLKEFEKIIGKDNQVDLLVWENLLHSSEFKEYQLDKDFLAEFTQVIKGKNISPMLANKIYNSINFVELQMRYGKQVYKELDIEIKAKAKYWDSMMEKNDRSLVEKTLGRALVGLFFLIAVIIIIYRVLLVATIFGG